MIKEADQSKQRRQTMNAMTNSQEAQNPLLAEMTRSHF
jgi:hypothetical protein